VYSVVKEQVKRLPFSSSGINPFTHCTKGFILDTQNRCFSEKFQKIFDNKKKPPVSVKKTDGINA
jgi:hypothetical protein